MKRKYKFVWIDDTPQRERSAKNMSAALTVDIDFRGLKGKDVNNELQKLMDGEEPDLILMDHSLDQAEFKAIRSGSSAAAIIRETWPSCPIVSITGTDISDMDSRHRSAYESVFQFSNISKRYSKILSIAEGFYILKNSPPRSTNDLLAYLKTPSDDYEKMSKILPQELKDNFEDRSLSTEFFRWCDAILFKRPGFLYDRQWTATFLGLSDTGFKKVENLFDSAKYNGVFSDISSERWWKTDLLYILGNKSSRIGLPWELGKELVGDKKNLLSKCHVSQEIHPETVGATDTTNDAEWHPMKLKYTEPHPNFEDMLFFEELRIMKPAE